MRDQARASCADVGAGIVIEAKGAAERVADDNNEFFDIAARSGNVVDEIGRADGFLGLASGIAVALKALLP